MISEIKFKTSLLMDKHNLIHGRQKIKTNKIDLISNPERSLSKKKFKILTLVSLPELTTRKITKIENKASSISISMNQIKIVQKIKIKSFMISEIKS